MNTLHRCLAALALLGLLGLGPSVARAAGAMPQADPGVAAKQRQPEQANPEARSEVGVMADDADALAQYQVLREYFERQTTLDDRLPELFSRRVRTEETMAFLAVRGTVNSRGQLERFRLARVDLSGLTFKRITADPDLARIHVTGSYSFTVAPLVQTVEEDALFVLLPEMGQWKIFERRAGWRE